MIDTGDVTMFCHWNKRLVCKKGFYCDTCKHQLAADDKENGKAEPVQLRWTEDYDGGRVPGMPLLWEYAVQFGAVHLLRSKISARCAHKGVEQAAGGSTHGLSLLRRGENTLVGARARSNGHFHGRCTACGCVVME